MLLNILSRFIGSNKIRDFAPIPKSMSKVITDRFTSKVPQKAKALLLLSNPNQKLGNQAY